LIVDDIAVNLRLLQAKLAAEYYAVIAASSGAEAIEKARTEHPDIVLLDVMMPEMDGFETCRRLKTAPETAHIPVVMVTALLEQKDRVQGLEAGADDFLTKPIDDAALFSRLRSLLRFKMLRDELKLHEATVRQLGAQPTLGPDVEQPDAAYRVLVVGTDRRDAEQIAAMTEQAEALAIDADLARAVTRITELAPDVAIIDLALAGADALKLCALLRSQEATRHLAILLAGDAADLPRLVKALDLGVNDYLMKPVDPAELTARVRTQLRYRRYRAHRRGAYLESFNQACHDGLTGLFNRRYLEQYLTNQMRAKLKSTGPSLAVLMFDLDHFKAVNDTHGHQAGDTVLRQFGARFCEALRGEDIVARYGGEEFVAVLTLADPKEFPVIADRLRLLIAERPFPMPGEQGNLPLTTSVGGALWSGPEESVDALLKRADSALYRAKSGGRNCVVMDMPPAGEVAKSVPLNA
jgi:two-component system cell cycle response regulator